jgi:glycosyltransferase involved in cell wall biosynthesis
MTTHVPRLTVLLPVYNGEKWLRAALDSVLSQSMTDIEVLAFNDGSSDSSGSILDSYRDARLRVIHQENAGLAITLNRGVQLAQAPLIARQDADDVSLPERFRRQCDWMDAHPEYVLIGGRSRILEGDRETTRGHAHPESNAQLQLFGLFDSYFVHSAVMFRRHAAVAAGNYPVDAQRNPPEDFDLWSRMAMQGRLANLHEEVLLYREVPNSISRAKAELISARGRSIAIENVCRALHIEANGVVADLVAVMRIEPQHLSAAPSWPEMHVLAQGLLQSMSARFPDEVAELRQAHDQLMRRLSRMRLQLHPAAGPLLKGALRAARLIRRIVK